MDRFVSDHRCLADAQICHPTVFFPRIKRGQRCPESFVGLPFQAQGTDDDEEDEEDEDEGGGEETEHTIEVIEIGNRTGKLRALFPSPTLRTHPTSNQ